MLSQVLNISAPGFKFRVLAGLVAMTLAAPATALAPPDPADYDQVILAARRGDYTSTLPRLKAWTEAHPDDLRILDDYAVVLHWAERHDRVLALWPRLDRPELPDYVARAVGDSARTLEQYDVARAAYRRLLARVPGDLEAQANLALSEDALGEHAQALQDLDRILRASVPADGRIVPLQAVPLLRAKAELLERNQRPAEAGAVWQQLVQILPENGDARRRWRGTLVAAGAAPSAAELTAMPNEDLSRVEDRETEHASQSLRLRWAMVDADQTSGAHRFQSLDQWLAANLQEVDALPATVTSARGQENDSEADRAVALVARHEMQQAIDLYLLMRQRGAVMPPYAVAEVADAYANLRQPESAEILYREAIARCCAAGSDAPAKWRIGLARALGDQERHAEAEAELNALVAQTPAMLYPNTPTLTAPNPDYSEALLAQVGVLLDANRLDRADSALQELIPRMPANVALRVLQADAAQAHLQPRLARALLQENQVEATESSRSQISLAGVDLALRHYAEVRRELADLRGQGLQPLELRELEAAMAVWQRPELRVTVGAEHGAGVNTGGSAHDLDLDTYLFSAPLADRWRLLAHQYLAHASIQDGTVVRNRSGLGGEFRDGGFDAQLEVDRSAGRTDNGGVAAVANWQWSDAWKVRGRVDTNSNGLPYPAYAAGVTGRDLEATVSYLRQETLRLDANFSHTSFSDGNQRNERSLTWTEQWLNRGKYSLTSEIGIANGSNSLSGARYFNPSSDSLLQASLTGEWRNWRRYERGFSQRLTLDLGSYRQGGFGSGSLIGLRYEQRWELDRPLHLSYGVGLQRRPFDGIQQSRQFLFLDLDWYF